MFKLVIVEDEDHIRHSLVHLIPWDEIGFQVVGAFSDGSDALAYLKDNPSDAVLTDIRMARMSGLEMTRCLHEIHPQVKVVILSGYGDFAYAQEAIRYKVEHYLVKPVDEDELMDVFRGIGEQLREHTALLEDTQPPVPELYLDDDLCAAVAADHRLLMLELDLGCKETLLHILDGTFRRLQNVVLEDVRDALKSLYDLITETYESRHISVREVSNGRFDSNNLYSSESREAIAEQTKEDFAVLCDSLLNTPAAGHHSVVVSVIEYLNAHIQEDISHDEIAKRYRIHPGYLSRLFKQEMGETMSDYLLRIRIEKAAVLLKEGRYKIGEVASMVGYSASSYFSLMFKKYTGCSPREYGQRISM